MPRPDEDPLGGRGRGRRSRIRRTFGRCFFEIGQLSRMLQELSTPLEARFRELYALLPPTQIVRWNGPVGDFTYLASGGVPGGVHDGDTLSASIAGSQITLLVNGTVVAQATDSTFATGDPGIAFWRGGACGTIGDYGLTHYSATSIP